MIWVNFSRYVSPHSLPLSLVSLSLVSTQPASLSLSLISLSLLLSLKLLAPLCAHSLLLGLLVLMNLSVCLMYSGHIYQPAVHLFIKCHHGLPDHASVF